jgi:hypothetical protein
VLAGNDATLSGASVTVIGDAEASVGTLGVTASAGDAAIGGSATAGTALSIDATGGDATVSGAATAGTDLSITATGVVSAASVLAANNATLSGASVTAGNVSATGGDLTVTATAGNASVGAASAGGNASLAATGAVAAASVLAGNDATLSGASVTVTGDAEASVGTLGVTASAGDASIGGSATAGTDLSITATVGNVVLGGDITSASADVELSGANVIFSGAGAQAVRADNATVVVSGNASKAMGDLTLTGRAVNAGGSITLIGGSLSVTATAGDAQITGDVTAGAGVEISATGGNAVLGGNISATNGDVALSGAGVTFAGSGDQAVHADSGLILIDGLVTKPDGDLTLSAGTSLVVTGAIDVSGSLSSTSAGASTFGGSVTAGDDLTLSAGSIQLFGDLTGGSGAGDTVTLTGPIVLHAADSRWSAHGIRVNGSINGAAPGAQTLRLAAGDRSILDGGIGDAVRLGEFRIEDGFTQLGTIAGGLFLVRADHFTLAPASRPSNVSVDLASSGDLVFHTGEFAMAQGTKATVLGSLTVNSGTGTARLSDVNTTGVFEVNAGQIVLVSRPSGISFTSVGDATDTGLDFVSLGGFRFSVAPTLDGAGFVRFASPNATGDLNSTLAGFVMLNLNASDLGLSGLSGGLGVVEADFFDGARFFDLIADYTINGSSAPAIAIAGATEVLAPQDTASAREEEVAALSVAEQRRLEALLVGLLGITLAEPVGANEIGTDSVAVEDHGRSMAPASAANVVGDTVSVDGRSLHWRRPMPSAAQRFHGALVRELLATSDALLALARESATAFSSSAGSLADAYASREPLAAVVQRARAAGNDAELEALRAIARFVELGEELDLSTSERLRAGLQESGTMWPQSLISLEGDVEFKVPASAFDADFWLELDRSVASE